MSDILTYDNMQKLIKEVINYLPVSSQTKLNNIDKASVEGPLSTKRVSQGSRTSVPYDVISHFALSQLQTHSPGIVIRLPFCKYEEIRDNPQSNELDSYLLRNVGGNETVSCFIYITKEDGYSGSGQQRIEYDRFKTEQEKNGWTPIYRHANITNVNKGNEKWSGHYYINISGGTQDCIRSHLPDKEDQIFTTYRGCMSTKEVIIDVKLSLIWQLLHCFDITDVIPTEKLSSFLPIIECYLKSKIYLGNTCYDLIHNLGTIKKGILYSPIHFERLSIRQFSEAGALHISHNEAVCKQKMYFCETQNVLLSDYRPGNLFWDTKMANMQQQDFTIDEYWIDHDRRSKLREFFL